MAQTRGLAEVQVDPASIRSRRVQVGDRHAREHAEPEAPSGSRAFVQVFLARLPPGWAMAWAGKNRMDILVRR